jgi:phosphoglycerol geranylgeranyltransferase
MNVYDSIRKKKARGRKQFAVLIDPDKFSSLDTIRLAEDSEVDLILVGGSLLTNGNFSKCVRKIKRNTSIPVLIFPGNHLQISKEADAILLLSLISGRNPDLLIGKHILSAPLLRSSRLEILSTGYMLVDSGKQTTALYMSSTQPIPHDKDDIALCTAMAGEMLGLKLIYMDAGSGAINPVSESMIRQVSRNITVPLIVGGGINDERKAGKACKAGADIVVVGNAIEKDKLVIRSIAKTVHSF